MQITRETDYAIRCILHMSEEPERVSVVDEISKSKNIPKSFLAKILQRLVKAGIVFSLRGVKGGFHLAKEPKDISLLTVIEAIEGPISINKCVLDKRICNLTGSCTVHPVWLEIRREIEEKLSKKTFDELLAKSK